MSVTLNGEGLRGGYRRELDYMRGKLEDVGKEKPRLVRGSKRSDIRKVEKSSPRSRITRIV